MGKKYIGIDPSTKTGLVILGEDGTVLLEKEITSKVKTDPHRFMDLSDQVITSINQTCVGDEAKIQIEGFSYGSKGAGVSTQYGIGWSIRSLLVECLLDYTEITPGGLKKFASGKGNTKKDGLVLPIFKKWGFESDSDNIRDAYVLAQIGRYLDGLEKPTKYQAEVLKNIRG